MVTVAAITAFAGVALVVAGAALVSVPAALIIGGIAALMVGAFLVDVDRPK